MTAIGLDLVFLAPGATGGMETYARALVPELARRRPGVRWVAFCGRELAAELRAAPWISGMEVVELPVSSDTRVRRVAAEQTLLARAQRRAGVDLVHALGNTAALAPGGPPLVLTIHDLIWRAHPETHAGLLARGLSVLVPRAARRASAIVTPSRATAADVERFLDVPADRIHVVPSGPGAEHPDATPEAELRARLGLGDLPLVLCPAPRRPHKNVARLVAATAGLGATVVVPGYASIEQAGLQQAPHARFLGWVDGADMEGVYRAATLLAFPSLAEGFGLPVLEAMRRGLPVACSNTTSLPEVAGDAALTFDPLDEAAIRDAVSRLLGDAELRQELAARGREQAARFSWEAAAEGTWAAYDRVLAARRHPAGLLRRIGAHPRVEPATALLLRARTVRQAPAFALRELRGGGRRATYDVRSAPVRIVVRHGVGDAPTVGEVFHERDYEPPAALDAVIDPGSILDLGANIGLFGAFAAARWPRATIAAYEPDPANADVCRATIEANRLGYRWTLHRAAAANHDGELRFHASGDALSHAGEGGNLIVEARDVLGEIAAADLVKMDIEGGEWEILRDPRFAAAPPRAIVLEYHPHPSAPDPRAAVEQLLRDAGLAEQSPIFHRGDGHGMLWAWRS
ncbi:MAG TPA: FkbM family methyltransferase [Solirubrobacteraceae bacterium]|nr:FkbM family methyltransferase [Solirubrobacteraceae bacterium]